MSDILQSMISEINETGRAVNFGGISFTVGSATKDTNYGVLQVSCSVGGLGGQLCKKPHIKTQVKLNGKVISRAKVNQLFN